MDLSIPMNVNTVEHDSDSTHSRTSSTFEDDHDSVTTPELEEQDGDKSVTSDQSDDDEEQDSDNSVTSDQSDDEEDEDDDGKSVSSDSSELPSTYLIEDHEVQEDYHEPGPLSLAFVGGLLNVKGKCAYKSLPVEVQVKITTPVLLPKNQVVRLVWKHETKEWIYRGNAVPFVQWGFEGVMKHEAKEFLHPAPELYNKQHGLLVDYSSAEFRFDYNRCGSRVKDQDEYLQAMSDAASIVRTHSRKPQTPNIRALQLSYCPKHYAYAILKKFRHIPGLERVDLQTHDHYARGSRDDSNLRDEEVEAMQFEVTNSVGRYAFEVTVYADSGEEIEANDEMSYGDPDMGWAPESDSESEFESESEYE